MTKVAEERNQETGKLRRIDDRQDLSNVFPKMMDSFFSSALRPWSLFDFPKSAAMTKFDEASLSSPRLEVTESENDVQVEAELPGVSEKDVKIELRNGSLWIKGEKREDKNEEKRNRYYSERRYGSFERLVQLPCEIERDKVEAAFKDGILKVTLPKTAKAKEDVKQIPIKH